MPKGIRQPPRPCPKCENVMRLTATKQSSTVRYYACHSCKARYRLVNNEMTETRFVEKKKPERQLRAELIPGARVYVEGKFMGIAGDKRHG